MSGLQDAHLVMLLLTLMTEEMHKMQSGIWTVRMDGEWSSRIILEEEGVVVVEEVVVALEALI